MLARIKQIFCRHEYEYERPIPWCMVRGIYKCKKCGKIKLK